jgi:GMP synthase (glutamine-hydrolysing) A subunit
VYAEILPFSAKTEEIRAKNPRGIILSGGPSSVHAAKSPRVKPEVLELGIPVLGICYGMQLMVQMHGGKVAPAARREFGRARIAVLEGGGPLFDGLPSELDVWMSHGDGAQGLGNGFTVIARTDTAPYAAIVDEKRRWYGVQFHPEVVHTPKGEKILENFARRFNARHLRHVLPNLDDVPVGIKKLEVNGVFVRPEGRGENCPAPEQPPLLRSFALLETGYSAGQHLRFLDFLILPAPGKEVQKEAQPRQQ